MGQYDIALRRLVEEHGKALAQVLVPAFPIESVAWIESQLPERERRMDRALELRAREERLLLHLEVAVDPRRTLAYRMFEYAAQSVMAQHAAAKGAAPDARPIDDLLDDELVEVTDVAAFGADAPIESAVLLLRGRKRPWPREACFRISRPGRRFSGHWFRIEAVYQRSVAELWDRPGTFWLVFTPLAPDANVDSLRRVLEEIRHREPDEESRSELYAAMLVLAELDPWGHHLQQELERMIWDMDVESIMASKTLRTIYEQGEQKGLKEGHDEGLKEGLTKGHREAIEQMLRGLVIHHLRRDLTPHEQEILAARAGSLDIRQAGVVVQLDPDALEAWLFGPDAE